jgi:hypothetical protein
MCFPGSEGGEGGGIGARLFGSAEGGAGPGGGGAAASDPVPTPTPATPPTPGGPTPGGAPDAAATPPAPGATANPAVRQFGLPNQATPTPQNPQEHMHHFMMGLLKQLVGPSAGGMPGSGATPIAGNGAFAQLFNGATGAARRQPAGGQPGAAPAAPAAAEAPSPQTAPGALPPVQQSNPFQGLMQLLGGFGGR